MNALPEGEDFRTPWERGASGEELIAYEREMVERSDAEQTWLFTRTAEEAAHGDQLLRTPG